MLTRLLLNLFTLSDRMCSFKLSFSGLGYIMGATIANATGDWRWALRVREYIFCKYCIYGERKYCAEAMLTLPC